MVAGLPSGTSAAAARAALDAAASAAPAPGSCSTRTPTQTALADPAVGRSPTPGWWPAPTSSASA